MVFVFFASVLRFPGCRLVFPRIKDLRRQWHRGDAQSPFRTWKLSPVAAMVLRSEGRGRVARCRITRHRGVSDSRQRVRHPPLFIVLLVFLAQHPKKQNKTNFCVTADETISFFPCLALVLLTTANNALSHQTTDSSKVCGTARGVDGFRMDAERAGRFRCIISFRKDASNHARLCTRPKRRH